MTITNSITFTDHEHYRAFSDFMENGAAEKYGISDISLLEDYLNIIFESTTENSEAMQAEFAKESSDTYFMWMRSDDELIISITTYSEKGFGFESINKTMEQIALSQEYGCSGSCSDCDSDCEHKHHDEDCDCDECTGELPSVPELSEMMKSFVAEDGTNRGFGSIFGDMCGDFCDMAGEFDEQFGTDSDVLNDEIRFFLLCAATADGTYSESEHECVLALTDNVNYDTIKNKISQNPTLFVDELDKHLEFLRYIRNIETETEIYKLIYYICTYICCVDGDINEKEKILLDKIHSSCRK